ncbi:MAG: HEAT repeat domain-containing protein [Myxococcota bacterium]|nr:HEAT repeat domain-containing protein [Myxococcota bacterium]
MKLIFLAVVLTASHMAMANPALVLEDGLKIELADRRLIASMDGKKTWSMAVSTAKTANALRLEQYDVAEGVVAIHAVSDIGDGRAAEVVLIRKGSRRSLKLIWQDITGLSGDVGEKTSPAIRFEDLDGDGRVEIVKGVVLESVRMCGQAALPLLFREVYNFKKGAFWPILARRPGLKAETTIDGSFDPGTLPTAPIVRHILPIAASRIAGDRREPLLLAPPRGIADGDPKTAWIPMPSNGAGELTTFDIITASYGVLRIGILPLPSGASPTAYDRPKSIYLATQEKVYRLRFPVDPAEQPDTPVWFDLKASMRTQCFSLVIENSYAPSQRRPLAISEVIVITEADGPKGLFRLAEDLSDTTLRRQAAMLLERAGARALPAIRHMWPKLDWQGKQRAIRVVARSAPTEGVDLLVQAAMGDDPEIAKPAQRGLLSAKKAAVPALERFVQNQDDPGWRTAVDLLSAMGTPTALIALARTAGRGDRDQRHLLRKRITRIARQLPNGDAALWTEVKKAEADGDKERVLDLLRSGTGMANLATSIADLTNQLYWDASGFEDRYRLINIMGDLACHAPQAHLASAAKDPDRHIRAAAVRGLGACSDDSESRQTLIASALDDAEPSVRMAALDAMAHLGRASISSTALTHLAISDPWPDVRARSVLAAQVLGADVTVALYEKTARDASSRVRAATIESALSIPGEQVDEIIQSRLSADVETAVVKKIAAFAAGSRCQRSAVPSLFALLKKGAEPLAGQRDIATAREAARALGNIGTPEAKALLKKTKQRSNPAVEAAIDRALAKFGKHCQVSHPTNRTDSVNRTPKRKEE